MIIIDVFFENIMSKYLNLRFNNYLIQMNKKVEYFCLDVKCGENSKLISNAEDMMRHKSHSIQKTVEQIFEDFNRIKDISLVEDALKQEDLNN